MIGRILVLTLILLLAMAVLASAADKSAAQKKTPEAAKKHMEAALPRGAEGRHAGNAAEFEPHSLDWLKLQLRPTGSSKSAHN